MDIMTTSTTTTPQSLSASTTTITPTPQVMEQTNSSKQFPFPMTSGLSSIQVTFAEEDAKAMVQPAMLSPGALSPPAHHHSKKQSRDLVLSEIKKSKMALSDRFNRKPSTSILESALDDGDEAVLGIHNYTAQQIWKQSAMEGTRNNMAKYAKLYPNLMAQFRKWTGITKRVPTQNQLRRYFIHYSKQTNHKSNIELLMHSNQFELFYVWFKSMSEMIRDFRHLYDSEHDVLSPLFCSAKQAKQKLAGCAAGTFLIRIGQQPNKLFISCKMKDGNVAQFKFVRIEDEIYKHGKTQNPIFQTIRTTQQFERLYSVKPVQVTVEKSHYF